MIEDPCKECGHAWVEHRENCKHQHCSCPKWIWDGQHPGGVMEVSRGYREAVQMSRVAATRDRMRTPGAYVDY